LWWFINYEVRVIRERSMLRMRLRRVGAKKQPSYRVVLAESDSPQGGRFVELLGFYNPRTEPSTVELKEDRVRYWLGQGVLPSDAVLRLLEQKGIVERAAARQAAGPEVAAA
jgi:small subunit ribosomal protein S16